MIVLNQIKKIFNTNSGCVTAVDSVNLSIRKGEIFGIIGYSGAGKSTLIRMLNLLERPTEGTVTIDGKDLTQISSKELRLARQQIGMVFQHFNLLWSRTVFENIAFSLEIAGVKKEEIKPRFRTYSISWFKWKRRQLSLSIEWWTKTTRWDCTCIG